MPSKAVYDVTVADSADFGKILSDGKGMTLYTYAKDSVGTITCYGACAASWPPLLASSTPRLESGLIGSGFSLITRTDGTKQVAYKGMPLYRWDKDAVPGDTSGEGIGGVWFVHKVAADDLSAESTSSSASSVASSSASSSVAE